MTKPAVRISTVIRERVPPADVDPTALRSPTRSSPKKTPSRNRRTGTAPTVRQSASIQLDKIELSCLRHTNDERAAHPSRAAQAPPGACTALRITGATKVRSDVRLPYCIAETWDSPPAGLVITDPVNAPTH